MIYVQVQFFISNEKNHKEVYVAEGETLFDLMPKIGINRNDNYFFVVNSVIRPNSYTLVDGDNVKIFPVMSGG